MNTLEDRIEAGAQLKRKMNCCQAVLVAYADRLGKSEDELMRLGSGFGSGMGTMEGTCGALVGAIMVKYRWKRFKIAKCALLFKLPRYRRMDTCLCLSKTDKYVTSKKAVTGDIVRIILFSNEFSGLRQ